MVRKRSSVVIGNERKVELVVAKIVGIRRSLSQVNSSLCVVVASPRNTRMKLLSSGSFRFFSNKARASL